MAGCSRNIIRSKCLWEERKRGGGRGRRVNCLKRQATQGVGEGAAMECKRGREEEWDGGETKLLRGDQPLAGCGVLGGGK